MVVRHSILPTILAFLLLLILNFSTAASVSVIGGSDGPTAVFVTTHASEIPAETEPAP